LDTKFFVISNTTTKPREVIMKKNQTIIVIGALLISLAFIGAALAAGMGDDAGPGFRHRGAHGKDGLGPMAYYVKQTMAVSVLAELSGKPAETVKQRLEDHQLREFMAENNIDRQAFRTAMKAKMNTLVQYLTAGGYITPEQAKEYTDRVEHKSQLRSERRELMNQLIEKGVADGTITPEQAQLLQPKRFNK
jgi:polyhydroxyalkanoate synthesis regulator phasin